MKKYLALIAYTFLFTSFSIVQSAEAPKVELSTTTIGYPMVSCNLNCFDMTIMYLFPVSIPYEIITKCSINRMNVTKENNGK